jgi:hypothetical protein
MAWGLLETGSGKIGPDTTRGYEEEFDVPAGIDFFGY